MYTMPNRKAIAHPGLNPGALRPPWGQCARRWVDATAHLAEIFPGRHAVLSEWQLFPNLILESVALTSSQGFLLAPCLRHSRGLQGVRHIRNVRSPVVRHSDDRP